MTTPAEHAANARQALTAMQSFVQSGEAFTETVAATWCEGVDALDALAALAARAEEAEKERDEAQDAYHERESELVFVIEAAEVELRAALRMSDDTRLRRDNERDTFALAGLYEGEDSDRGFLARQLARNEEEYQVQREYADEQYRKMLAAEAALREALGWAQDDLREINGESYWIALSPGPGNGRAAQRLRDRIVALQARLARAALANEGGRMSAKRLCTKCGASWGPWMPNCPCSQPDRAGSVRAGGEAIERERRIAAEAELALLAEVAADSNEREKQLEADNARLREALTALMSLMYPFAYPNNPDPLVSGAAVAQWTSVIEAALAPEQEQSAGTRRRDVNTSEAIEIRDRAVRLGLKNCCDQCRKLAGRDHWSESALADRTRTAEAELARLIEMLERIAILDWPEDDFHVARAISRTALGKEPT